MDIQSPSVKKIQRSTDNKGMRADHGISVLLAVSVALVFSACGRRPLVGAAYAPAAQSFASVTPVYGITVHSSNTGDMPAVSSVDEEIERFALLSEAIGAASADDIRDVARLPFDLYTMDTEEDGTMRCPAAGVSGPVGGCYSPQEQMFLPGPPAFHDRAKDNVPECDSVGLNAFHHEMIHRVLHVMNGDLDAEHKHEGGWYEATHQLIYDARDRCFAALEARKIPRIN